MAAKTATKQTSRKPQRIYIGSNTQYIDPSGGIIVHGLLHAYKRAEPKPCPSSALKGENISH